jgi:PilZ domain
MIMGMSGDFISRLLFSCRHQFSWPRRAESGDYYQVCVHCGTEYRYDWGKMQRVEAVTIEERAADAENRTSLRRCGNKKTAWTPRERRLRHKVTVQFRVVGSKMWHEGTTENISKSGVLFQSSDSFQEGVGLELVFEMPKEVTGDEAAPVLCKCTVARVTSSQKEPAVFHIACSVSDYEFMKAKASDLATRKVVEINKRLG